MPPSAVSAARALAGRLPPRNEALPLALLLLALASVFAFGGDRSQFYRPLLHDSNSIQTMTLSTNLSAEHDFLRFHSLRLDRDGEPRYDHIYNRLPIGSYVLVGMAILPFGDDFPRAIRAARLLMLAFFAAAATLAYLALARLLGDRRIALAATLLAFSSYYLLHYSDTVSAEDGTNLFGVMLVLHGMALFVQEGRFRQLLAKTAVAILLGWHVLGLIGPFVLLGLASEARRARRDGGGLRASAAAAIRGRHMAFGAFSVLCAAVLLVLNLGGEYLALGGEVPLSGLPSFDSFLRRTGQSGYAVGHYGIDWPTLLRGQFGAVGGVWIPFAAVDLLGLPLAQPYYDLWPPREAAARFAAIGAAVFAACLAGLWKLRLPHRAPLAALLLVGWSWAIPFPVHAALHEFLGVFHVGAALVLWALALLGLRRLAGPRRAARALPAIAVASLAVFTLSAALMARVGHDAEAAQRQRELVADFSAIRGLAAGRSVLVGPIDPVLTWREEDMRDYYLTGSYLQIEGIGSPRGWREAAARFDFVALPVDLGGSLTPGNSHIFLYRPGALAGAYAALAEGEAAARSEFEVRLDGRTLTYTRDECPADVAGTRFRVEAVPLDMDDLPAGRRAAGFEAFGFALADRGAAFGGACVTRFELPDYPVAGVRTGQRAAHPPRVREPEPERERLDRRDAASRLDELPPVWEVSLPVGDASFPRGVSGWRETVAAAEPVLSSVFDVYLEGRTLHYLRDDCAWTDPDARFFVRVAASGEAAARSTFAFLDRGLRYEGACLAAFGLPDGDVLGVRTGQYAGGAEVWAGEFPLDPEAWRARFEALAASEPALSSAFAVHLEGRMLHYAREECAASDAEARFFLHVTPLDPADLPEARRAAGFDNLDFAFGDRGLRYEGRCLASARLPDYGVARVVTGQFDADGAIWEGEVAVGGR